MWGCRSETHCLCGACRSERIVFNRILRWFLASIATINHPVTTTSTHTSVLYLGKPKSKEVLCGFESMCL
uniref:Uncharacterized protein n=1 Tax=Helianthus annuus TaxID=4232 RepID=A0A251U743_HELAN